jgi:hypothetical protein
LTAPNDPHDPDDFDGPESPDEERTASDAAARREAGQEFNVCAILTAVRCRRSD